MILSDPYPQFQGHAILWRWISQKSTTCRHSVTEILIGTYTRPTQQCHFEWPWVTLSDLAKHSMTRSVARSLRQLSFLFHLWNVLVWAFKLVTEAKQCTRQFVLQAGPNAILYGYIAVYWLSMWLQYKNDFCCFKVFIYQCFLTHLLPLTKLEANVFARVCLSVCLSVC